MPAKTASSTVTAPPRREPAPPPAQPRRRSRRDVVIIGASTGGPVALTDVLMSLPRNFGTPILLVQHMPENFTKAFAQRSEEHTSELQSRGHLVCRLLLEKKKYKNNK